MFISPLFISFLFSLAVLFIFIGVTKPKIDASFENELENRDFYASIKMKLIRAGLVDTSPIFVVSSALAGMLFMFLIVSIITGNVIIGIVATLAVPLATMMWINRQEKNFIDKANANLVPFLRQIEAQVVTGQNATQAFRFAVERSKFFKVILREPMNELRLNKPFTEVLDETVNLIPTKGWVQFVKALNLQMESGGDLATMISSTVDKINARIRMQEIIRGKYKTMAGQQNIILLAGIFVPVFFYLSSPQLFANITGSIIGLGGLIFGVFLIIAAIFYSRSIVNSIEEKINY